MEVYEPTPRGKLFARLCSYLAGLTGASTHTSPHYMDRVFSRDLVRFSLMTSSEEKSCQYTTNTDWFRNSRPMCMNIH